jgi:hypothetical protein
MIIGIQILNVLFLLGFSWLVFVRQSEPLKKIYWPALTLKILGGFAVGAVYFYFYGTGDTVAYHRDAGILSDIAIHGSFRGYVTVLFNNQIPENIDLSLVAPRAVFFSKIVSVFSLLSGGNYWIISAYFSLIAFFSAWYLVKRLMLTQGIFGAPILAFLFFPSVVFWSSGIIKESVACASLFVLTEMFLRLWFKNSFKWYHIVLCLFSLYVLWALKYHYAAIFIAVVITMFVFRFVIALREFNFLLKLVVWVLILLVPMAFVTLIHPNFNFSSFLSVVVENNQAFVGLSSPDDLIYFSNLAPTITSVGLNAPLALFSGLFRPMLWEAGNVFQYIAGIENLFVILLFISSCFGLRSVIHAKPLPLILGAITFITILTVFICLSTPNFGTLSRYKVGYEPFFIMLILSNGPVAKFLERKLRFLVETV